MARKSIAPWSERVSEGLIDQPIDSVITASQTLTATVDTGFIDQSGTWKGVVSSDAIFGSIQLDSGIADSATILTPSKNADGTWPLDMTGYQGLFVAIKPTNGGAYAIKAVMGPSDLSFGGLTPLNAAALLRGNNSDQVEREYLGDIILDSADTLIADVWNIFYVGSRLREQKVLQWLIINNSGGSSDIETAFMRIV